VVFHEIAPVMKEACWIVFKKELADCPPNSFLKSWLFQLFKAGTYQWGLYK